MYNGVTLLYTWNTHNIVNQLYSNILLQNDKIWYKQACLPFRGTAWIFEQAIYTFVFHKGKNIV